MKEMTDQELTDKISQVFDDYEDPSAGYGWQQLLKKYPENNSRPVVLWWSAAAAVLLIVGGLWFIIPDTKEIDKAMVKTDQSDQIVKPNASGQSENTSNSKDDSGVSVLASPDDIVSNNERKSLDNINLNGPVLPETGLENRALIATNANRVEIETVNALSPLETQTPLAENSVQRTPLISLPEQINSISAKNDPEISRDSLIDATAKMLALAQRNPADNHTHQVKETPYASQKINTKNHAFSFYAGSYFNYSLGSETKLNFGAGFTSDIKLTTNLKLSTGLALANNSLTYNNGVPASGKEKLKFDALPSFGLGNTGTINNNLTTITKYDASLLALDIPINLKYLIIPKDNKLYLLAGLSSGTYLTETYALDYRNYSQAGAYISQTQGIEEKKRLQAFDFARILNISFGYSANLGKTQNITLEPFLKYPLGGLGSEDLKFGSTGINLKLNFSQFKKR